MKTPLTIIITGAVLGLLHLCFSRQIDVVVCTLILFGTALVALTIEQYGPHRLD